MGARASHELRRDGRKVDARTQLSLAYGSFAEMGAKAYAERARRELAATGAHRGAGRWQRPEI